MPQTCTRCENTGFLNLHQIDDETLKKAEDSDDFIQAIKDWIEDLRLLR